MFHMWRIKLKIENYDDLIVAFGLLIEEAMEFDFVTTLNDVHEAFEVAFDEAVEEELKHYGED